MINILALSSLALATLHIGVALVSAHGYVSAPPSRQARCRNKEIPNCGDAQFEPQSVQAPHGSLLCNGGGGRFRELNNNDLFKSHYFTVPAGVNELTFIWTLTVPHRTNTWEYIAITSDNDLLISYDYKNTIPPTTVTQKVPLGGLWGRQTILARWNIADTPNTFYSCIDLLIESSGPRPIEMASESAAQLPVGISLAMPGPGPQF